MKLISVSDKTKNAFTRYVNTHPNSTCMQMWEWAEFRNKLGSKVYERLAVVDEKGEIKLAATYSINRYKIFGNVLYFPHGPVWSSADAIAFFAHKLTDITKKHDAHLVVFEPRIYLDSIEAKQLVDAGMDHRGNAIQPRHTVLVDLTRDREALLSSFSKKTRYNIRYAEKNGVTIKTYQSPDDVERIDAFYSLLRKTQERSYFAVQPKKYFQTLYNEFAKGKHAAIQEAWVQDELVASIILLHNDGWASSIFSASSRKFSKLKPTYLLRWENILLAKKLGAEQYDFFGATDSTDPSHPFYSTTRFKLHFGNKVITYTGTFEKIINPIQYNLWKLAENLGIIKFYERSYLKEFRKKHATKT